jgi:hypothetical protein
LVCTGAELISSQPKTKARGAITITAKEVT